MKTVAMISSAFLAGVAALSATKNIGLAVAVTASVYNALLAIILAIKEK
jgi:hypothetical protein